ncbi:unnamed protein product [Pedinophyceae sp. YPF-701]|nr:unnamed protein product [Pedinophyceae sp. YPF-701]
MGRKGRNKAAHRVRQHVADIEQGVNAPLLAGERSQEPSRTELSDASHSGRRERVRPPRASSVNFGPTVPEAEVGEAYLSFLSEMREEQGDGEEVGRLAQWATVLSIASNIILLFAKGWVFFSTLSMSVLASFADSVVDLASQGVLLLAARAAHQRDARFPVGRTRLNTVSVMLCAGIMSVALLEVIQESIEKLWVNIRDHTQPVLELTGYMYAIMLAATGVKLSVWIGCKMALRRGKSNTLEALAIDARVDFFANTWAIGMAAAASRSPDQWWLDPAGGIMIAVWGLWSWGSLTNEQVNNLVGRAASEDFVQRVREVVDTHHDLVKHDSVRAYHFGESLFVELEVIMPASMTVAESHDIAVMLQHKVEALPFVERCFVHVDYTSREEAEHKVDRNLAEGQPVNQPHPVIRGAIESSMHRSGKPDGSSISSLSQTAGPSQPEAPSMLTDPDAQRGSRESFGTAYGTPTSQPASTRSNASGGGTWRTPITPLTGPDDRS